MFSNSRLVILTLLGLGFAEADTVGGITATTTVTPKPHDWGNLTAKQIEEFKESFHGTDVERFLNALDRFNEEAAVQVEPSEKERADMLERLKLIKTHAYPVQKNGASIIEVNQRAGVASSLYAGDVMLTDEQVNMFLGDYVDGPSSERKKRQAYYPAGFYPANIWGSTFYYFFDPSLTAKAVEVIKLAIAFWHNSTCINFVESSTATNRVRFFKGSGCYSMYGMTGGVQDIIIGDGCEWFGTAAHEIGHALGFFHEQARHDRDTSVTVNTANIKTDAVSNFRKETTERNNNYNMPYDYGSVMQYGANDFSSNGQPTLVAKLPVYQDTMGSYTVSFYDISMMNEHYQCKQKCTSGATCLNGGFRNSRNCNSCVCPTGWSGPTCADRPTGCGATLTATATAQIVEFVLGTPTTNSPAKETCNYLIKAPVGSKVEVVLKKFDGQMTTCSPGCMHKSIEFKAMNDHRYTGIRTCCPDDVGMVIVSEGHLMPIIAYNSRYQSTISFSYRFVPSSTPSTVQVSQAQFAKATYDALTNPSDEPTTTRTTTKPTTATVKVITAKPTTAKVTTTTKKVACTDGPNCVTWVPNGFCASTAYTAEQRAQYCPVSCKLCPGTATTKKTCVDNANCVNWVKTGFCTSSTYTLAEKRSYCPNVCNLCN